MPQDAKYVPGIHLKGLYLKDSGFASGDFVKPDIRENQITITKTDVTDELSRMVKTNPALSKLIDEFELTAR
ncbi:MAG: type I toxin-antitoxin system SymE family toxin [Dysgonamonadaceae bacterium]|nr:type I toxin-antitoxin system SymE family toxin [Dysgonamonadaceae bacterium]